MEKIHPFRMQFRDRRRNGISEKFDKMCRQPVALDINISISVFLLFVSHLSKYFLGFSNLFRIEQNLIQCWNVHFVCLSAERLNIYHDAIGI